MQCCCVFFSLHAHTTVISINGLFPLSVSENFISLPSFKDIFSLVLKICHFRCRSAGPLAWQEQGIRFNPWHHFIKCNVTVILLPGFLLRCLLCIFIVPPRMTLGLLPLFFSLCFCLFSADWRRSSVLVWRVLFLQFNYSWCSLSILGLQLDACDWFWKYPSLYFFCDFILPSPLGFWFCLSSTAFYCLPKGGGGAGEWEICKCICLSFCLASRLRLVLV